MAPWHEVLETPAKPELEPTLPHFYDPHGGARQQIEDEIHRLEEQLQQLRVQRNSLLPISSLPTEILIRIFESRQPHEQYNLTKYLLPMTWVCHHWRIVALSYAPLWAHINDSNLYWALHSLARSKEAKLTASFEVSGKVALNVIDALSSHIHRIRLIKFEFEVNHTLGEFWSQPAPALEELQLRDVDIPIRLFSGVTPSLRKLILTECSFKFTPDALPLSNLVSLTLVDPKKEIPIEVVLRTLSFLQSLEQLSLTRVLHLPKSNSQSQVVHLRDLRNLQLFSEALPAAVYFLEHIDIPLSAQLSLRVVANGNERQFIDLLTGFRRIHDYEIALTYNRGCLMIDGVTQVPNSGPFEVSLYHRLSWTGVHPLLLDLPIHHLQTLIISDDLPEVWTSIDSTFPNLQNLCLRSRRTIASFIQFIALSATYDDHDFPLPNLRVLEIETAGVRIDVVPRNTARKFYNALRVRKAQGIPLIRLETDMDIFEFPALNEVIDEFVIVGYR
ncbi:hypothetical protein BDN72DRAFT_841086 [Pluteus cervinus]|uniref:Uncharacterized protein n=1 Tax=Pluteus cervinus TaxID=181527 RepID=A0ACD3AUP2_9AGAR|nr:hypothetical protein BDN72DRAFT_841086 [Pluteus cervinus]